MTGPEDVPPEIRDYYARAAEEERLSLPHFRLEEARTRRLLERLLPPAPAVVLDVGGGAGAYAFWLAERGYEVHLLDASERLVALARDSRHRERPLASVRVGDARALPFEDAAADAVLLLGPLYHLCERDQRIACLREARRALRPGGRVLAAGISRFASVLDGLTRGLLGDPRFRAMVERDLATGDHRNESDDLDWFTTAFFHVPADLAAEVAEAGFEAGPVLGVEGPAWILPDAAERLDDPERREALMWAMERLESEPAVVGSSAHLMVVGRKPEEGGGRRA